MSIKSYLQKAILKIGSHAAMPSGGVIQLFNIGDVSVDSEKRWTYSYTAPYDGKLTVFCQKGKNCTDDQNISLNFYSHSVRMTQYCADHSLSCYVARGDVIQVKLENIWETPLQAYALFQATIGGLS